VCAFGRERVNSHAAVLADFQSRVNKYLNLRKQAEAGLPRLKPTESPEVLSEHELELARTIRTLRPHATAGEIFTPEITRELRRLVKIAFSGGDGRKIRASLRHAEPVGLALRVNDEYPGSIPLQSMPATLIANLPALPPQLAYRVIGRNLVLRDVGSNLIVDVAKGIL
jgi:hypothetical protein